MIYVNIFSVPPLLISKATVSMISFALTYSMLKKISDTRKNQVMKFVQHTDTEKDTSKIE